MRIPVVDARGVPLMPCTPPKARILLKEGKARSLRSKLGLFYLQLTYEQQPDNQCLVVGIDPGSKFEGYSVVGVKGSKGAGLPDQNVDRLSLLVSKMRKEERYSSPLNARISLPRF